MENFSELMQRVLELRDRKTKKPQPIPEDERLTDGLQTGNLTGKLTQPTRVIWITTRSASGMAPIEST